MKRFLKLTVFSLCLLALCGSPVLFAKDKQGDTSTQHSSKKESGASQSPPKRLQGQPVPFAHFEQTLKNSERWKSMSPEEQNEALEKIKQARERFRKNELERQKQYLPLLKKKPFKGKRMTPEYDEYPDEIEKHVQ